MVWTFRGDQPIYAQLVEQIKLGIVSGEFSPGERLVSVRDMAADAGVNPNTLQRALQELEREGLVYSQRTSGRFVTEDAEAIGRVRAALAAGRLRDFLAAMEKLGYTGPALLDFINESIKEDVSEHESES